MIFNCFASCSFGLSGIVKRELIALGAQNVEGGDARVYFRADSAMLMRANIRLRCADRIYIVVSSFSAGTFEELYEGVRSAAIKPYIGKNDAFPMSGDSVRSRLKSVSDVQAVAKKAAADNLMAAYGIKRLNESGTKIPLHMFLLNDTATLAINTSGAGLNRRGYRTSNAEAPIRETLAAGIIAFSGYRGDGLLIDPMCGSGTLAIEGYMYAANIAPGLNRGFDMERFSFIDRGIGNTERESARDAQKRTKPEVSASDIDEKAIAFAKAHAKKAGVDIDFKVCDAVRDYEYSDGVLVCNPPYAIRMGEQAEVRGLYSRLGARLKDSQLCQNYICADDSFERNFGRRADAKKKLYNGNIRCNLYSYRPR